MYGLLGIYIFDAPVKEERMKTNIIEYQNNNDWWRENKKDIGKDTALKTFKYWYFHRNMIELVLNTVSPIL